MVVKMQICCDNDAFADDPAYEVARILREASVATNERGLRRRLLLDINGNDVGEMVVEA